MIAYISRKTVIALIHYGTVHSRDAPIYQYGCEILISSILNFISIIVIALTLFYNSVPAFVYLTVMIPLRMTLGGYHADSYLKCWLLSNFDFLAVSLMIRYLNRLHLPTTFWVISTVTACIILLNRKPNINVHHSISRRAICANKKAAKYIVIINLTVWLVVYRLIPNPLYAHLATLTMVAEVLYKYIYCKRSKYVISKFHG